MPTALLGILVIFHWHPGDLEADFDQESRGSARSAVVTSRCIFTTNHRDEG